MQQETLNISGHMQCKPTILIASSLTYSIYYRPMNPINNSVIKFCKIIKENQQEPEYFEQLKLTTYPDYRWCNMFQDEYPLFAYGRQL